MKEYEILGRERFRQAVMGMETRPDYLTEEEFARRMQWEYDHSLLGAQCKFTAARDIAVEAFNREMRRVFGR
jgi:hypothetical protein